MNTFWKLVEKSTITSGLLAIAFGITVCYCVIAEIPVPEYIISILSLIIGFFFSAKAKDAEAARKAS